ncbi:MAG: hypothetical protein GYA55_06230, partial [SAR324 cluster bacterium]|nr:hypothetical protein [SAR324 cluster bacterium]
MKPEFPRWTNPYIDKVESIPELLLPCFDSKPSYEELSALREKYSSFERMYCELGSGSGKHLIERAKCDSSAFYVGFELRYKRAFKSAAKAKKLCLRNLIILRTNAFFIDPIFEARSLDGIYVNFPDPWDRRRWEGNRILKPQMFDCFFKLLKPRGFISYKTDHIERFRETVKFIE